MIWGKSNAKVSGASCRIRRPFGGNLAGRLAGRGEAILVECSGKMQDPSEDDPQALARACAEAMLQADRATHDLGIVLEEVGPGHARMSMPVADNMANGHGMCHGGFIFALADSAFAFACNSHGDRAVAQHGSISFIRPAERGMILVATAVERVSLGRGGIYDVRVTNAEGAVIAEFRGHSRTLGQRFFGQRLSGQASPSR